MKSTFATSFIYVTILGNGMQNKNIFYIFGILQALTLGFIVFFILGTTSIGKDTSIVLSILFPVFTLLIEYLIYSKK